MTKIRMFSATNPSRNWAVSVDGYFGYFGTREEAERVYDAINPAGYDFDSTPFGSCQLIQPGYSPVNVVDDEPLADDSLADHRPIDIADYIRKTWERHEYRMYLAEQNDRRKRGIRGRLDFGRQLEKLLGF